MAEENDCAEAELVQLRNLMSTESEVLSPDVLSSFATIRKAINGDPMYIHYLLASDFTKHAAACISFTTRSTKGCDGINPITHLVDVIYSLRKLTEEDPYSVSQSDVVCALIRVVEFMSQHHSNVGCICKCPVMQDTLRILANVAKGNNVKAKLKTESFRAAINTLVSCNASKDRSWGSLCYLFVTVFSEFPSGRDVVSCITTDIDYLCEIIDLQRTHVLEIIYQVLKQRMNCYEKFLKSDVIGVVTEEMKEYMPPREFDLACHILVLMTSCSAALISDRHYAEDDDVVYVQNILSEKIVSSLLELLPPNQFSFDEKQQQINWCMQGMLSSIEKCADKCQHIQQIKASAMADFEPCDHCFLASRLVDCIHGELEENKFLDDDTITTILGHFNTCFVRGMLTMKRKGMSAMMLTVKTHNSHLCRVFLEEYGAAAEQLCPPVEKKTATLSCLGLAASKKYMTIMKLLVKHGARMEPYLGDIDPPLHLACYSGNMEAIQFLIRKGADAKARGRRGMTTLMYAHRHRSVCEYLLDLGVDPHAVSDDGATALTIAVRHDCARSVALLLNYVDNEISISDLCDMAALHRAHKALATLVPHLTPDFSCDKFKEKLIESAVKLKARNFCTNKPCESKVKLAKASEANELRQQVVDLVVDAPEALSQTVKDLAVQFSQIAQNGSHSEDLNLYCGIAVVSSIMGKDSELARVLKMRALEHICHSKLKEIGNIHDLVDDVFSRHFRPDGNLNEEKGEYKALEWVFYFLRRKFYYCEVSEDLIVTCQKAIAYATQTLGAMSVSSRAFCGPLTELREKFSRKIMYSIISVLRSICVYQHKTNPSVDGQLDCLFEELKAFVQCDFRSDMFGTLLHLALKESVMESILIEHQLDSVVRHLVEAGCNVNARNKDNETALHLVYGILQGEDFTVDDLSDRQVTVVKSVIKTLLDAGVDIDTRSRAHGCSGLDILYQFDMYRTDPVLISHIKFERRSLMHLAACALPRSVFSNHRTFLPSHIADYIDLFKH